MSEPLDLFVYRAFAGRQRKFQLNLGGVEELERICRAGIGEVMLRLASHRFGVADVREPIRLGLQGGGLSEPEATALTLHNVDSVPLGAHLQLAGDVLAAYVNGIPPALKKTVEGDPTPAA